MHQLEGAINRPASLYMYYVKILRANEVNSAHGVHDVD